MPPKAKKPKRAVKKPKKRKQMSVNCHVEYCSAIKCDNSRDKTPDLSFFRFPNPGKTGNNAGSQLARAHKWWIFTRRSDKNFKNDKDRKSILQMVLCEEHFDKDQFKNPAQKGKPIKRKRLRGDALPLLFDVPNPPKQQTPSRPGPKRG
ncbi:hypothetical protein CAPTEDRAFT_200533 [Capitella teleta]|uniref:THAP-type domain-containing protein n=1 Tax=Capitella teleta TaxID=283909 RepID=R7TFM9_CAPTE|nr:hypothetical protein CAPTEDRAFT_200533 [Capitella teleta]|eukprot:ELT89846.1 hypothetical protein CAPTEDRAFT_200533 [Capitella teleta]